VIVFMLLGTPVLEDLVDARLSASDGKWVIEAKWRERRLSIEGEEGRGPTFLRICSVDGKGCYEARYRYESGARPGDYPEKIVCERKGGSERLSLTVESVRRAGGTGL